VRGSDPGPRDWGSRLEEIVPLTQGRPHDVSHPEALVTELPYANTP
jgi:hypothetical protein